MNSTTHPKILVGLELECFAQSATVDGSVSIQQVLPQLPGPHGSFTSYGRIYRDGAHLELATAECASPFTLVACWERLAQSVAVPGLANCNHSGLLCNQSPAWGAHGNYLSSVPPETLADRLLPFFATQQIVAGAGGVHWPSGQVLAGVRAHLLDQEQGGGTTSQRALFSTARREHLTADPARFGYRLHTIHCDGVRSHWSLLLQLGATALVLHALIAQPAALLTLPGNAQPLGRRSFWMQSLAVLNRLSREGDRLLPHPLACQIQRLYLQAADQFVKQTPGLPAWPRQLLAIWDSTLSALERGDQEWLAQRLDPWIKFRLFGDFLAAHHADWDDLSRDERLASGLALLNQNYHEFTNPDSAFAQLEAAGELKHRVTPPCRLGDEPEPYVPDLGTRAVTRARFIKRHSGEPHWQVDWHEITNTRTGHIIRLDDPLAATTLPTDA